jgi:hypothetical protein
MTRLATTTKRPLAAVSRAWPSSISEALPVGELLG